MIYPSSLPGTNQTQNIWLVWPKHSLGECVVTHNFMVIVLVHDQYTVLESFAMQ